MILYTLIFSQAFNRTATFLEIQNINLKPTVKYMITPLILKLPFKKFYFFLSYKKEKKHQTNQKKKNAMPIKK